MWKIKIKKKRTFYYDGKNLTLSFVKSCIFPPTLEKKGGEEKITKTFSNSFLIC